MAYTTFDKDFTPVGKGTENKTPYPARQVSEETWKHETPEELMADLLAITSVKRDGTAMDGSAFNRVQSLTLNAVNQYLRFEDAPGADPMTKLLAFAKKAGISAEDLIAKLS